MHAIVLYYNKDAARRHALPRRRGQPDRIDSLEDFDARAAALKEKGVETPLSFATGDDGGDWRVFYTLLPSRAAFIDGGEVLPGDNAEKAAKASRS